jgi:hypothetical protein
MKKYSLADYAFQFITVTAGVLIALFIDGLAGWNSNRELVKTSHAMIAREVADNLKELEGLASSVKESNRQIDNCMKLADDLLSKGKSDVSSVTLNFNIATLNKSSWLSAERMGALAHMSYDEVKEYSELYSMQDLFDTQQRKAVDLVGDSIAWISSAFDPTTARREDVTRFRDGLMRLRSNLVVTEDLGGTLIEAYRKFKPVE